MPHKPKPKNKKPLAEKSKSVVVKAPTSKSVRKVNTVPSMKNSANGVVIEHTEYFMDVTSTSSNFQAYKLALNPGIITTFPWLSAVAERFESYLFDRLEIMYKPLCSTTTPGVVILAVDYDALDPAPNSKVVANSYAESTSSSVWDTSKHFCKGTNLRKFGVQRYVRTGTPSTASRDMRIYDVGNLFVCTSNTPPTATPLGEVWVSYKVRLFTPQITSTTGSLNSQNTVFPGYSQSMSLNIASSVINWTGEYYNQAIAAIQQVSSDALNTFFDIVFNPTTLGRRFLMMLRLAGNSSTFGIPPGLSIGPNSPIKTYRGDGEWNLSTFQGDGDRIFFMEIGQDATGNNPIPALRFQYPNNISVAPQLHLYQYDGPFPDSSPYNLNTISGGGPGPTQNLINWGSFLTGAVSNFYPASFTQTFKDGKMDLKIGKKVDIRTLNSPFEALDLKDH